MSLYFLKRASLVLTELIVTVSIFGATNTDSRLKELEQQMKQVRTETAAGTYGARTASARPEVDGGGASFSIDALLWKVNVGGTEYAYTDSSPQASFPVNGSMQDIGFDWDWGVRVGVGYNFAHDNWESNLVFTYFSSNESDRIQAGSNSSIVPIKGLVNGPKGVMQGSSRFKFVYDNLDLDLGRNCFFSKSLSLKSYFGLKNTWLNLEQKINYATNIPPFGDLFILNKCNSKFWGIGPSIGVNGKWFLCNELSFFGNAGGSLLWSYFQVKDYESINLSSKNYIKIGGNAHKFVPAAELVLGLSYDSYINANKQHVSISIGWDTIYYWRSNQTLKVVKSSTLNYARFSDDISIQGVTLHVRLDF